jgi:NAD(P)-dependent dehydrogenase (short-subunit alcohol dehydrogenase family)
MSSDTPRGTVVITGTSTGIGAACAVRLANEGFSVFAGVRRAGDAEALQRRTPHELTPLVVDITDEAAITEAANTVKHVVGDRGLAGLVNNAGIVVPGPLEFQPMSDVRHQLEVNLSATLR